MTQNPIIDIKNVHKSFGKVEALKGVNLRIEEGEFFSLARAFGLRKDNAAADDCGI